MRQTPWLGGLIRNLRKPGFWLIAALLVLVTIPHYGEHLSHPAFLTDLSENLGLDRHAFERIAYLLPIIWAGFLFGQKGAFITSMVALGCMLPRAIFISEYPMDAFFEISAVFILGNVVAFSFNALRKERDRRADLERAENALQLQLQVIRESERRLTALNQTSAILSQSLEPREVLDRATANAVDVMQVDAALIYEVAEDAGELVLASCRGLSQEVTREIERISLKEGFNATVVETGAPLFIEDVSREPRLTTLIGKEQGVKSLLCLPLKSKGKVVGTLCLLMLSYRWFRQDEVDLINAIANQVGVAIENARLYEKERLAIQRLAVSERNYRGLFETANDAIWVHDMGGNIIVANKAAEKQTGYALEELKGLDVKVFLSGECLRLARQVRRNLLEGLPMQQPYEQCIIRKDGTRAILTLTTSLVVEDGVPTGFQNISRDVTEEIRMRENLNYYLGEVTRAQEEERKRIARELHDDTVQALVVLARQLDELSSAQEDSVDKTAALENLWQQTNGIIQGVRRLSQDLRPPTLDRLGLLSALEWLVSDVSKYAGLPIEMKIIGSERRLPQEQELMLFRIIQEALRNVWRHSHAARADVTVELEEARIRITVRDDGKGFDVPNVVGDLTRLGKLGLAGMQERARLLGGVLKLESVPGQGTAITVEAPIWPDGSGYTAKG